MIYDWLYRKFIKPIVDEFVRQSQPCKPEKIDPIEYPTMAKLGITHMQRSKVPGCPPIFLLPSKKEPLKTMFDNLHDIDVKKPRMRCHESWFYFAGVLLTEQTWTWTCISDSAQGIGNSMADAYRDWALRLTSAERIMRGIHLGY